MKNLKTKEQRIPIHHFRYMDFLVKARFEMQLSKMNADGVHPLPILNEIVYIADQHSAEYKLIVSDGKQQYLMNSDGKYCSEGYDRIIQLFNKTPHAESFVVEQNNLFGVLDHNGNLIIPCTFKTIELLPRLQIKGYAELERVDSNVVSFYICMDEDYNYFLYNYDGKLIFKNTGYILPGKERIEHTYEPYMGDRLMTRTLETIQIYMFPEIGDKTYYRNYIYKLDEKDNNDHITFVFLESEGSEKVIEQPPIPLSAPHIGTPYPGLILNWGYGRSLCKYIRNLFSDDVVYTFIDPMQIHWDQITHLKRIADSMSDKIFNKRDENGNLRHPDRCFMDVIEHLEHLEMKYKR